MVSFFYKNEGKTRLVIAFKIVIGLCNFSPFPWTQLEWVFMPVSETKKTPFGARLWMYFTTVDRLYVKLFLFSNVLLNITFLKMAFIVVQWETENSVSVVSEEKLVGAVELKEWTTVDISNGINKGRVDIYKATILRGLWWVKIAIFVTWSKSYQRIETRIILRIESVTCMPQFLKLTLYNEINLSVRFPDNLGHVWEHSRFIIQTVIKQTWLHKEALLDKNKVVYSALFK